MTTAQTIVSRALRLLNENSHILGSEPYHEKVAFEALVDLLVSMRSDGLYVTPQIPSVLSQDLFEKPFARKSLIYQTAFESAASLQIKEFPPTFDIVRDKANRQLYVGAKPSTDQQYPSTLPTGSGNYDSYSWSYNYYCRQDFAKYDIYDTANTGNVRTYYADFDRDAVMRDTFVVSVQWEVLNNKGTLISNESLSTNLAQANIKFVNDGVTTFKATATYDNGEVQDFLFKVQVSRP